MAHEATNNRVVPSHVASSDGAVINGAFLDGSGNTREGAPSSLAVTSCTNDTAHTGHHYADAPHDLGNYNVTTVANARGESDGNRTCYGTTGNNEDVLHTDGAGASTSRDARRRRFRCIKSLGEGGYSSVWLVYDRDNMRIVALKLFLSEEWGRERAEHELRMVTRARGATHEDSNTIFIAHYYELFVFRSGQPCLLLQPYPNTLLDFIIRGETGNWERKRKWMCQLATAIAHMHANGVGHFDLKPDNILVESDDSLRVTDFNCASECAEGQYIEQLLFPAYAPPEVHYWGARAVSLAADVWALGCILLNLYGESIYAVNSAMSWAEARVAYAEQARALMDVGILTRHVAACIHESDEEIKSDVVALTVAAMSPIGERVDAATFLQMLLDAWGEASAHSSTGNRT